MPRKPGPGDGIFEPTIMIAQRGAAIKRLRHGKLGKWLALPLVAGGGCDRSPRASWALAGGSENVRQANSTGNIWPGTAA